jgi:uncharacterized iron-regulated membrane protein
MRSYQARLRKIHRVLAPIMVLPVLLTLFTGAIYQIADLGSRGDQFDWLLDWHKGRFGSLNLAIVYPFLNALGLLVLAITGISMWFQGRRNRKRGEGL